MLIGEKLGVVDFLTFFFCDNKFEPHHEKTCLHAVMKTCQDLGFYTRSDTNQTVQL